MPTKTPKEAFLLLLSHVRRATEKEIALLDELETFAQDPDIKEALEARAFVYEGVLGKLDQCFKDLGEKPIPISGRLEEMFMEDFRKELKEIQSPVARRLFFLANLVFLTHLRIGEYTALVAAADISGHHGVGVLLESCLADKLALVERTRRFIRKIVEAKVERELTHA